LKRRVDGWLVVDKPAGVTSTQVSGKVRWALRALKAGHAGTLDPAATGVLAVALGEATKTMPYVADAAKSYQFTVRWGAETSTDDAEGEATVTSGRRPTVADIEAALPLFRGDILQVPPQVSAVKVGGERAYDLAREGVAMELAARPLHVARLDLVEAGEGWARLQMDCGKGGYVRAVARDLGRALGCLGHVETLRRTKAGPFDLSQAVPWEALEAEAEARLLPVEAALLGLPEVPVSAAEAALLRQGRAVPAGGEGEAWAHDAGRAVALGVVAGGVFQPRRVIAPPLSAEA
jgi:tRNA pseudouridine55 synthase